jgi:hypothetical protein
VPLEVETVSVEVAKFPLVIDTVEGLSEQLGGDVPMLLIVHARVTLPEYPLIEAAVTVAVAVLPEVMEAGFSAAAVSV